MRVTHKAARTVALVRMLHAANGHRRHGGRLPRQQQPNAIRREYDAALQSLVVQPAAQAFARVAPQIVRLFVEERREQGKYDGVGFGFGRLKQALDLVAKVKDTFDIATRTIAEVAQKFGQRTSDFQKVQLDRQVKQAVGVPYSAVEKPTREILPKFVEDNVALIKTVPERYFDSLRAQVQDAFASGMHPETLAKNLAGREVVTEWDARRIACDQIGKLTAQFNQVRQESLGLEGYIWRGVLDDRERAEHISQEGDYIRWDNPPPDGHPGQPPMCRCHAEPDFGELKTAIYEVAGEIPLDTDEG